MTIFLEFMMGVPTFGTNFIYCLLYAMEYKNIGPDNEERFMAALTKYLTNFTLSQQHGCLKIGTISVLLLINRDFPT